MSLLAISLCCSAERLDVNISTSCAADTLTDSKTLEGELMLTQVSLLTLHIFPSQDGIVSKMLIAVSHLLAPTVIFTCRMPMRSNASCKVRLSFAFRESQV